MKRRSVSKVCSSAKAEENQLKNLRKGTRKTKISTERYSEDFSAYFPIVI